MNHLRKHPSNDVRRLVKLLVRFCKISIGIILFYFVIVKNKRWLIFVFIAEHVMSFFN